MIRQQFISKKDAFMNAKGIVRLPHKVKFFEGGDTYMGKAHPGFKAVQSKIEKEGYSKKAAGAILAHSTRTASKSAKKANPRLNKVK